MSIVAGVVFTLIGSNQAGAFLVFSFLAFIGIVYFYRAFTVTFSGAGNRRYGYLVFFLPTLMFWTSDVSKEAIMTFLLGLMAYGCARILAHRRLPAWLLIMRVHGGGVHPTERDVARLGRVHHSHALPAGESTVRFQGPRRTVAFVFLGAMTGVAIFVTLHFLPGLPMACRSPRSPRITGTGSGFGSGGIAYSANPIYYPKDVFVVLLDPLPLNAHGSGEWFEALENTVLLVILIIAPGVPHSPPGGVRPPLRTDMRLLYRRVLLLVRLAGEPGPDHPGGGHGALLPRGVVHPRGPRQHRNGNERAWVKGGDEGARL